MKTRKQFIGMAFVAILVLAFAIIGCKQDVPTADADTPKIQPATPRTFTLGTTACKVTITSNDLFTTAEWNTLCDKVVSAIGRGYGASTEAAKNGLEAYLTSNNVSVVLSKSATYDAETKSDVPKTIFFKANGSAIDGISEANLITALNALRGGSSYSTP
jgi:hypothetical protein